MSDKEPITEENGENFEQMFEQSLRHGDGNDAGEIVTGTIVSVSSDSAFVDISGKSDAMINITEFMDENGDVTVKTGDPITGYVVSTRAGEMYLTSKIGLGFFSPELLETAYTDHLPVYGRIVDKTRGGYTVSLAGTLAFCPLSQIDIKASSRPEDYLERTLQFRVIEYSSRGNKIVLSRRALMEEQRGLREAELKKNLSAGDTIRGTVHSIQNFGIFVDIGGFQALLPKSEISWSRDADTSSFIPGNEIEAVVKSIDWDNKRISLSVKDLTPDPWSGIDRYESGQEVSGKVVNIIKNGVFVEIEPGVEGFIHVSNLNPLKKVNRPEDVVSRNDAVTVRILSIRPQEKKISLELATGDNDPWRSGTDALCEGIHEATVESVKPAGVTARLDNGMLGFIPREELRMKKGGDMQQEYTAGSTIKVIIKKLEPQGKRMILSEEGAFHKAEKQEYEHFMNKESSSGTSNLGSMLKDAFDKIKKDINN